MDCFTGLEQEGEGRIQLASRLVGRGWFSEERGIVPVDWQLLRRTVSMCKSGCGGRAAKDRDR